MKFLFMDETKEPWAKAGSTTSLTGLLISADHHREFRTAYHAALAAAFPPQQNIIEPVLAVHAVELFKDVGGNDEQRLSFLEALVSLLLDLGPAIYRVGYVNSSAAWAKDANGVLSLCFLRILWALTDELRQGAIWPVMEIDRSKAQDAGFAGQVRNIEHYTSRQSGGLSVDNTNLGELLYSTKNSSLGSTVDCIAYLRQARDLRARGAITPFKARLAALGDRLDPLVSCDEMIA